MCTTSNECLLHQCKRILSDPANEGNTSTPRDNFPRRPPELAFHTQELEWRTGTHRTEHMYCITKHRGWTMTPLGCRWTTQVLRGRLQTTTPVSVLHKHQVRLIARGIPCPLYTVTLIMHSLQQSLNSDMA